jgi:hypothetical protein
VPTQTSQELHILFLITSHPRLCLINGLFLSSSVTQISYAVLTSRLRSTHPTHFILLNLTTIKISGEVPHYVIFSLYPVTSYLLGPNILLHFVVKTKSYALIFRFIHRKCKDKMFCMRR